MWRRILAVIGVLVALRLTLIVAFRRGWFIVDWLRHFNKYVTNRLAMTPAGRRIYAVVHHIGRHSGRAYSTPVIMGAIADDFVIPIAYGTNADWCRNVRAAGRCTIEWQGNTYPVSAPELVEAEVALPAFPPLWRRLLRLYGVRHFLRLRRVPIEAASSTF
jgi:deazaflavin-dependent oxidoreductase (nitroreductase family)